MTVGGSPSAARGHAPRGATPVVLLALIIGIGFALRSILIGVAPTLPAIQRELHLSFTGTGVLSALPLLCMGAAAIPAALVVQRVGARAVIGAGLLLLGLGGILRVAPLQPVALYVCTAVMALGMAIIQPAMAVFIRANFYGAVQRVSGMFSSSLTLGSLVGVSLSLPIARVAGWRAGFVLWAIPPLLLTAVWWRLARPDGAGISLDSGPAMLSAVRHRVAWYAAAMFGIQALVFFTAATWIPFRFHDQSPGYLGVILFLFTAAGLPTTLVLTAIRRPWATSRAYYTSAGVLMAGAGSILLLGIAPLAWLAGFALNVGVTMTFAGANALPPLMARDGRQVGAMAGVMFTLGYTIAFIGPQLGGLLVDHTHDPASPFWIIVGAPLAMIPIGLTLPRPAR